MSLQAPIIYCQPEETARVARATFPRGNTSMRIYDALGPMYHTPQFAHPFPKDGQPALTPAQLALVTVFQFVEGLSDRQAADAVRGRIDWKYATLLGPIHENYSWQTRAGVGLGDRRRTRYRGLAKTRLLHLLIATAPGTRMRVFLRVSAWLAERPAPTLAAPLLPD